MEAVPVPAPGQLVQVVAARAQRALDPGPGGDRVAPVEVAGPAVEALAGELLLEGPLRAGPRGPGGRSMPFRSGNRGVSLVRRMGYPPGRSGSSVTGGKKKIAIQSQRRDGSVMLPACHAALAWRRIECRNQLFPLSRGGSRGACGNPLGLERIDHFQMTGTIDRLEPLYRRLGFARVASRQGALGPAAAPAPEPDGRAHPGIGRHPPGRAATSRPTAKGSAPSISRWRTWTPRWPGPGRRGPR